MSSAQTPENVVVIGGGIIGSCSAYYLANHPAFDPKKTRITLLEASQIAGGASGKAGGLLALWAYPQCIVPLSYKLHQELAEKHGGTDKWGYRAVHVGEIDCIGQPLPKSYRALSTLKSNDVKDNATTGDVDANGNAVAADESKARVSLQKRSKDALAALKAKGIPDDLDWVDADATRGYEEMGTPATTAQVHPYLFTTSIAKLAQEKGVEVVYGQAISIDTEKSSHGNDRVKSVIYKTQEDGSTQTLQADRVVLSAGPWTQRIWPSAPISALRAHSVCIRPSRPISAYALFTSIALPGGKGRKRGEVVSPEIYARPNMEAYACGEGDTLVELPSLSSEVAVDEKRCEAIVAHVSAISAELRDGEVTARQACYLPNVDQNQIPGREPGGGGPIVGVSGEVSGLVIAAGHTCWGIQNGPGTGKLVSEFVFDGKAKSAKVDPLDPKRFGI